MASPKFLILFSLLNTLAVSVPSSFKRKSISTSPAITVSVAPPTGTPTLPFINTRSLI